MKRSHYTHAKPPSRRWTRLWWLALLLTHVPLATSSVGRLLAEPSAVEIVRAVAVALTVAFFVLKLLDVAWLRLTPGRRAWTAAVVCVFLLHADVIRRNHVELLAPPPDVVLLALGGGALAATLLLTGPNVIFACRPRQLRDEVRRQLRQFRILAVEAFLPPRFYLLARSCAVHRAPPA